MDIARRLSAEFIGTAWLVLGGCGSAVLAAAAALGVLGRAPGRRGDRRRRLPLGRRPRAGADSGHRRGLAPPEVDAAPVRA